MTSDTYKFVKFYIGTNDEDKAVLKNLLFEGQSNLSLK